MQTQEMYWKQKYDSLEENYNNLKNKYEKISHTITTNNGNYTKLVLDSE